MESKKAGPKTNERAFEHAASASGISAMNPRIANARTLAFDRVAREAGDPAPG